MENADDSAGWKYEASWVLADPGKNTSERLWNDPLCHFIKENASGCFMCRPRRIGISNCTSSSFARATQVRFDKSRISVVKRLLLYSGQ